MFRQFSSASDVWSFGVLLVRRRGSVRACSSQQMPYKGWANKKVTDEFNKGYRMPKPDRCPYEVYRLMIECWDSHVKVS